MATARKSSSCVHNSCICVGVVAPDFASGSSGVAIEGVPNPAGDKITVFNTSDPEGPRVEFTPEEWNDFLKGAKNGEFNLP